MKKKLPKIEHPIFTVKVPCLDKEINFRPFTAKEEKIFLMARESGDSKQIALALKQVIGNCLVNDDIEDIPLSDVEYLFINIRSKSINNVIEFSIKGEDGKSIPLSFNLEDAKTMKSDDHDKVIRISDSMSLVMKYPTIDSLYSVIEDIQNESAQLELALSCIDYIAVDDEIFDLKDYSKEEIEEFVDDFDESTLNKISKFFETTPYTYFEIAYKDSKGEDKVFTVRGTDNFFT
jgi:hypothetical protein